MPKAPLPAYKSRLVHRLPTSGKMMENMAPRTSSVVGRIEPVGDLSRLPFTLPAITLIVKSNIIAQMGHESSWQRGDGIGDRSGDWGAMSRHSVSECGSASSSLDIQHASKDKHRVVHEWFGSLLTTFAECDSVEDEGGYS